MCPLCLICRIWLLIPNDCLGLLCLQSVVAGAAQPAAVQAPAPVQPKPQEAAAQLQMNAKDADNVVKVT